MQNTSPLTHPHPLAFSQGMVMSCTELQGHTYSMYLSRCWLKMARVSLVRKALSVPILNFPSSPASLFVLDMNSHCKYIIRHFKCHQLTRPVLHDCLCASLE